MRGIITKSIIPGWTGKEIDILYWVNDQYWVRFMDSDNEPIDGFIRTRRIQIIETNNRDMIPILMRW